MYWLLPEKNDICKVRHGHPQRSKCLNLFRFTVCGLNLSYPGCFLITPAAAMMTYFLGYRRGQGLKFFFASISLAYCFTVACRSEFSRITCKVSKLLKQTDTASCQPKLKMLLMAQPCSHPWALAKGHNFESFCGRPLKDGSLNFPLWER